MRVSFFLLSVYLLSATYGARAFADDSRTLSAQRIVQAVQEASDATVTGVPTSHVGVADYGNLAFTYDSAVMAMVLWNNGDSARAQKMLDHFADRLRRAKKVIGDKADANHVYGITKQYAAHGQTTVGLINAVDTADDSPAGRSILEFFTTPGPTSFVIFSFLQVDAQRYRDVAVQLGEVLLAMQGEDGGVVDGDRAPNKVHTEPHVDAYAAFVMLAQVTGEARWREAAVKAKQWYDRHVVDLAQTKLYQGVWNGSVNDVQAEDVYAWSLASPITDDWTADTRYAFCKKLLANFLVRTRVALPNGTSRGLYLVDFTIPDDPKTVAVRGGVHPVGSVEWTAGAVQALQKSAIVLAQKGDTLRAGELKAYAELLVTSCFDAMYALSENGGLISFYASAQNVEVGPFGAIKKGSDAGWKTPYFFVVKDGRDMLRGGSLIGAWTMFPYRGFSPFVRGVPYAKVYDAIVVSVETETAAQRMFDETTAARTAVERPATEMPSGNAMTIVEPREYNKKMWAAIERARAAGNVPAARECYLEARSWAQKVLDEKDWVANAEKENALKKKRVGGLISYPWGQVSAKNRGELHDKILGYPLLNECGAAYWAMITTALHLGEEEKIPVYFEEMCRVALLHQIPAVIERDDEKLINGYWNAVQAFTNSSYPDMDSLAVRKILKAKFTEEEMEKMTKGL